jgi:hypothetical protein
MQSHWYTQKLESTKTGIKSGVLCTIWGELHLKETAAHVYG